LDQVKIHTGTRIKLKHVDEDVLSRDFALKLKEFAHKDERVVGIFLFALQPGDGAEQLSLAVAIKSGLFKRNQEEDFLGVVDEIQLMLPDDLAINLYRFGSSDFLAKYCVENVEPLYLQDAAWLVKQRKKLLG
jgi:hypothetical protein